MYQTRFVIDIEALTCQIVQTTQILTQKYQNFKVWKSKCIKISDMNKFQFCVNFHGLKSFLNLKEFLKEKWSFDY